MLRRRRHYVIYPAYFNSKLTRSQGRRVSLSLADPNPSLKKLVKSCEILNLEFEVQREKAFPPEWWKPSGRLLVTIDKENKRSKDDLVKEIAGISRRLVSKKKPVVEKPKKKSEKPKTVKKTVKSNPHKKRIKRRQK